MTRKPSQLSREELKGALEEQLALLSSSCEAFDKGDTLQAKHIAVHLRILWHTTGRSRGLVDQLGIPKSVIDTAYDVPAVFRYNGSPAPVSQERRLFAMGARGFVPIFDTGPAGSRPVSFETWWEGTALSDGEGHQFTRKDLVLAVANKDGGAHVDPELDSAYYSLTREGNTNVAFLVPTGVPNQFRKATMPSPVAVALRQVGHETLRTLRQGYSYDGSCHYSGGAVCWISAHITPSDEKPTADG